jgi:hypothetical protein
MKPFTEETSNQSYTQEELRTSSNNMLCTVVYEPLTNEEQEEINQVLQVAN